MKKIRIYLLATRPQFFTAIIIPVSLGAAVAWHEKSIFDATLFLLALTAGILFHAGANVLNDYFDFLNNTDNLNKTPLTPFAGGARFIQEGILSPRETLVLGSSLLSAGTIIGLYLVWLKGISLVFIGVAGLVSAVFYSAPPIFLAGRGLGELTIWLNFGLLSTLGSYIVQTGTTGAAAVYASLPISFLITGILYVNQFPDYEADREAGKRNLVVRLGPERGRWGMPLIMGMVYLSILAGFVLGKMPSASLLALGSLIFAVPAVLGTMRNYNKGRELVPAIKGVIMTHLTTGLILIASFLI